MFLVGLVRSISVFVERARKIGRGEPPTEWTHSPCYEGVDAGTRVSAPRPQLFAWTEFDVPGWISTENGEAFAWWTRSHPTEPALILKFEELVAVFNARTGKHLWTAPANGQPADAIFIRNGMQLLVLYADAQHVEGRVDTSRIALRRFDWHTRTQLEELSFDNSQMRYPPHSVVVDTQERRCAVTTYYCKEQSYQIIELETPMRFQDGFGLPRNGYDGPFAIDPPAFSPDGRLLACIDAYEEWWEDGASPAGAACLGRVLVHNLETNDIEESSIFVNLPENWEPENPEAACWSGLWAPRFLSNTELELTLSDGSCHVLQLPIGREFRIGHVPARRAAQASPQPRAS